MLAPLLLIGTFVGLSFAVRSSARDDPGAAPSLDAPLGPGQPLFQRPGLLSVRLIIALRVQACPSARAACPRRPAWGAKRKGKT